jgi:hypothetical protein
MANEKVSRPQPRSNDIGVRNWPSADRGPNASNAITQPTAISTKGVRHAIGLIGADAVAVDMRLSGLIALRRATRGAILRHSLPSAKAKVRDEFDLSGAWLHGRVDNRDWRQPRRSAI